MDHYSWLAPSRSSAPFFFFNDPPTTEIYTLSLHDALPIFDQAHKDHLHIAAHVYALNDARHLVADGVDVLAHSVRDQPVDHAFIAALLQHHSWYIPTQIGRAHV